MIKKIYNLFKILRKLAVSGAADTLNEIKPLPRSLKIIFFIFSIGSVKTNESLNKTSVSDLLLKKVFFKIRPIFGNKT